jgi:DNA-binding CsgD family transcriptional regulator
MLQSPIHLHILKQILDFQKDIYANETDRIPVIKDNYINEFSKSENSVRFIFDHIKFKVLQVSDNVEKVLGYPVKDFLESNMLFPPQLFTTEHHNFLYVWLKWALTRHFKYGNSDNVKQIICGVKVKHKDGSIISLMFRQYCLKKTVDGIPLVSAISLNDVTHLIKSDFYWGRIECGKEIKAVHHMLSTDKGDIPFDILSDREKETLRLLAEGKESKEIGKLLFISSHTVDNHRRNMIAKTGAKDTTALIQICKMVGII